MTKVADTDHAIHDLIAKRWSPYGFAERPVALEDLLSLFEAVRWAASSYNEQPWCYIVATKEDPTEFKRILACLVEPNQEWAQHAPVLALAIASLKFTRNGNPNKAALHDVGLASGNLCLEATARGIHVHQMIGIQPAVARQAYNVPDDFEPLTALAIGYAAPPDTLSEKFQQRDQSPRTRKPHSQFVFGNNWGEAAGWVT